MKKIRICGVQTHYKIKKTPDGEKFKTGGVDLARLINPLQNLPKDRFEVDIIREVVGPNERFKTVDELTKHYDILYFSYMEKVPLYLDLRVHGIHNKMKMVVDVDDNLWAVDPTHPYYKNDYENGAENNFNRGAIILDTDAVTVTSDYLKKRITEHIKRTSNIYVVPNFIDLKLYDYKKIPKVQHELTIGWMGGASHLPDLTRKEFTDAMTMIMDKYPEVRFKTTAYFPQLKALWGYKYEYALARFDVYKFIDEVWPQMMSDCDIFVAPLSHSNYSSAKSYIKLLEYGAGKKPVVAERIEPYQEFTKGKDTGVMLAYSTKEWFESLEKLILDEKLRKENADKLYSEVKNNHTVDKSSKLYADFFEKIYDMPSKVLRGI